MALTRFRGWPSTFQHSGRHRAAHQLAFGAQYLNAVELQVPNVQGLQNLAATARQGGVDPAASPQPPALRISPSTSTIETLSPFLILLYLHTRVDTISACYPHSSPTSINTLSEARADAFFFSNHPNHLSSWAHLCHQPFGPFLHSGSARSNLNLKRVSMIAETSEDIPVDPTASYLGKSYSVMTLMPPRSTVFDAESSLAAIHLYRPRLS